MKVKNIKSDQHSLYFPKRVGYFSFVFIAFFIGAVSGQRIVIEGELYLGEIFFIGYLFYRMRSSGLTPAEQKFLLLGFLWATAQLLSDILNNTAFLDSVKGVLAPIFFVLTTCGLINFFRARLLWMPSFLLGASLFAFVNLILVGPEWAKEYYEDNPWKWGMGTTVLTTFALYYSFFAKHNNKLFLIVSLFIFAIATVFLGSRGMAFIPLIATIAYIYFQSPKPGWATRIYGGGWGLVRFAVTALVLLFLLNYLATAVFSSDWVLPYVGTEYADKYRTQAAGDFGVLLGGRTESLVSIRAFLDKPLLGHGSWAQDKGEYLSTYEYLVERLGYGSMHDPSLNQLIPAHSYLMGSLVWSGIMGGIFWVYVLILMFKNFIAHLHDLTVYHYIGVAGLTWDILFSPFGASSRWQTAIFLAALLAYTSQLDKSKIL
jgi:hypothetical protein